MNIIIEYRKQNSSELWRFHSKYKTEKFANDAIKTLIKYSKSVGFEYQKVVE